MGRRRRWWALLAAMALVFATMLTPMEGAAYRIPDGQGPPGDQNGSGDPDVPDDGPIKPPMESPEAGQYEQLIIIDVFPGVRLQFTLRIPQRLFQAWRGARSR